MKKITESQGKKLNEIFNKYGLQELSIQSVGLWFIDGGIYREVTHLNREEIFELFNEIKYGVEFVECGISMLDVNLIVDSATRKLAIRIKLR